MISHSINPFKNRLHSSRIYRLTAVLLLLFITPLTIYADDNEDYQEALNAAKLKDFNYALELWKNLASKGHSKSQYKLGVLYRLGYGVEKDLDKAFQWFQRAAQQNHGYAQYNLAMMYLKGWGTPRDTNEAEKWFRKAAAHDIKLAQEKLNNLITDSLSSIDKGKLKEDDEKAQEDMDLNQLLFWAAKDGRTAGVNDLVALGANVTSQDKYGRTALMEAAYFGRADTVEKLLDLGANANSQDNSGVFALMDAAQQNHPESIKRLLVVNTDVNKKDNQQQSVLMIAVAKNHKKAVDLLLEKNANVNDT